MRREYKVRVWRCIAFVGLFLCFLLGLGVGAYAQNANDILGKAAAAYENSNGIVLLLRCLPVLPVRMRERVLREPSR